MDSQVEYVEDLIQKAREAQAVFEQYSQERVDAVVRVIGKAVYDHAKLLARMAVDETGMGLYEDKVKKNTGKVMITWHRLKGAKSRGIIRHDEETKVTEIAKPIGVIGSITPVTNPVTTPAHNAMIALKGGNAIIVAPHPRAKACGAETVKLMREAIRNLNAPEDLIQVIEEPTFEVSRALMQLADICISTGGAGVVKAAYSSGKPAFGVGAGNLQCLVDRGMDVKDVSAKVVRGRTFDHGVLCTCEQAIFVPEDEVHAFVKAFEVLGGHYIDDPDEVRRLREAIFPDGALAKDLVGASPVKIAEVAGVRVTDDTKLLVARIEKTGTDEHLSREKLMPVLALYTYRTWEEAVSNARRNLINEGKGHSLVVHSHDKGHVEYAAQGIQVSRCLVNQTGSYSLGGAFTNGLNPTGTLGCGSWGNNSISENLWFHHLINISRIAYEIHDAVIPSGEEIWG